jgi:putative DNA primase/helicase
VSASNFYPVPTEYDLDHDAPSLSVDQMLIEMYRARGVSEEDLRDLLPVAEQTISDSDSGKPLLQLQSSAARRAPAIGDLATSQVECTHLWNTNLILAAHGRRLFFHGGAWFTSDGKRWVRDSSAADRFAATLSALVSEVIQHARQRLKALTEESAEYREIKVIGRRDQSRRAKKFAETSIGSDIIATEARIEALEKWLRTCEDDRCLSNTVHLMSKQLTIDSAKLDAHPYYLNCENGTIDLRNGRLLPHNPEHYLTHIAPTHYDPAAQCPQFERFITQILDAERAEFMQRWLGYNLTGDIRDEYFTLNVGEGRNGKSKLFDIVKAVVGTSESGGYAATLAPSLFTSKGNENNHPTEIADLQGKRCGFASETQDEESLREALLKWITGERILKGRWMRHDYFEFARQIKVNLATNNEPIVKGQDHAIWSRILLIRYGVKFGSPEDVAAGRAHAIADEQLFEKLLSEREGILAWLVRGAMRWYADGKLIIPNSVRAATHAYQTNQDRIGTFVRERCVVDASAWTGLSGPFSLFDEYRKWALENGYQCLGSRKLAREVQRIVPAYVLTQSRHKTNGKWLTQMGGYGIRLKTNNDYIVGSDDTNTNAVDDPNIGPTAAASGDTFVDLL